MRSPGLRRLEQEAPRREARAEGRCCGRRTDTLPSKCFFSMGQSASARPRTRRSRRSAVFPRATCLDGRLPGRLSVLVVNSPVPTHAQHEHIVKACRSTATAARRRSPAALESVEVLQSAGSWETALTSPQTRHLPVASVPSILTSKRLQPRASRVCSFPAAGSFLGPCVSENRAYAAEGRCPQGTATRRLPSRLERLSQRLEQGWIGTRPLHAHEWSPLRHWP